MIVTSFGLFSVILRPFFAYLRGLKNDRRSMSGPPLKITYGLVELLYKLYMQYIYIYIYIYHIYYNIYIYITYILLYIHSLLYMQYIYREREPWSENFLSYLLVKLDVIQEIETTQWTILQL